jgi:hypothetical protein
MSSTEDPFSLVSYPILHRISRASIHKRVLTEGLFACEEKIIHRRTCLKTAAEKNREENDISTVMSKG